VVQAGRHRQHLLLQDHKLLMLLGDLYMQSHTPAEGWVQYL